MTFGATAHNRSEHFYLLLSFFYTTIMTTLTLTLAASFGRILFTSVYVPMIIFFRRCQTDAKRIIYELLRKYPEYQQFVWRNEGKSVILRRKKIICYGISIYQ